VNAADYDFWRQTFGSQDQLDADGNGDGAIDAADYVMWRRHMSSASGVLSAHAVPEPITFWLSFALLLISAYYGLNRKRFLFARGLPNSMRNA
jgi:hypothetical protein